MKLLKYLAKKYFYFHFIKDKFHPSVQIQQRQFSLDIKSKKAEGMKLPQLKDCGFRVFSQFEEDGLLLYIFSLIDAPKNIFIEIGSNDGVNSNCANLYFHHGWYGLFIDGDKRSIQIGQKFYSKHPSHWHYKPKFLHSFITAENINEIIESQGFMGDIGLLSVDIDGNDYWIWKALEVVKPQVVIIETHNEFGLNNIVVPYDPNYQYPGKHPVYHGASPIAMTNLAKVKGYRLIGANQYGFNFIFIQNDLLVDVLPTVSVESLLQHPSSKEGFLKFEAIKDWDYLEG